MYHQYNQCFMKKIWSIMLMLVPFAVWGQSHTDTIDLNQVVVTATQHASTRTEAPAVVGVVSHERMEAVSAVNLA